MAARSKYELGSIYMPYLPIGIVGNQTPLFLPPSLTNLALALFILQLDTLNGPLGLDGILIVAPDLPRPTLGPVAVVVAVVEITDHVVQVRQDGAPHVDQPRRAGFDARARDVVECVLDDERVRGEDCAGR